jgi:transposase
MPLSAKQARIRCNCRHGFRRRDATLLTAHGFSIRTIAALVKRGLVTIAREKMRTGGKWIDADKVRVSRAR